MIRTRWSARAVPGMPVPLARVRGDLVLDRATRRRQRDHERRPGALRLAQPERTAVLGDQPLGEVEPDALAGGVRTSAAPLEDRLPVLLRDPAPEVGDGDVHRLLVAAGHLDQAAVAAAVRG